MPELDEKKTRMSRRGTGPAGGQGREGMRVSDKKERRREEEYIYHQEKRIRASKGRNSRRGCPGRRREKNPGQQTSGKTKRFLRKKGPYRGGTWGAINPPIKEISWRDPRVNSH